MFAKSSVEKSLGCSGWRDSWRFSPICRAYARRRRALAGLPGFEPVLYFGGEGAIVGDLLQHLGESFQVFAVVDRSG